MNKLNAQNSFHVKNVVYHSFNKKVNFQEKQKYNLF